MVPPVSRLVPPLLGLLLGGYALLGKTAAYVHVGPLYAAEIVLALGALGYLLSRHKADIFRFWVGWALLVFLGLHLVRTFPGVGEYGLNALRDAALWYYALFLPIVFTLLGHAGMQERAQVWLTRLAPWVCWLALPLWYASNNVEAFPYGLKGGDTLVFVGLAYSWLMVVQGRAGTALSLWVAVTLVVLGLVNRGGLLSFLLICLPLAGVLWRRRAGWALLPLLLVGGVFLESGGTVQLDERKEISAKQISETFASLLGDSGDQRLDSTREWRLNWWGDILADTGPGGEYAATGHGYGVNLADQYGYQVTADGSLRSPHNAWMTYLARSGIPGLAAYALVLLTWAGYMLRRLYVLQGAARAPLVWALFGVGGVLLNGSVDVYLESPIGGVLLWSLMGFGLALAARSEDAPR